MGWDKNLLYDLKNFDGGAQVPEGIRVPGRNQGPEKRPYEMGDWGLASLHQFEISARAQCQIARKILTYRGEFVC